MSPTFINLGNVFANLKMLHSYRKKAEGKGRGVDMVVYTHTLALEASLQECTAGSRSARVTSKTPLGGRERLRWEIRGRERGKT